MKKNSTREAVESRGFLWVNQYKKGILILICLLNFALPLDSISLLQASAQDTLPLDIQTLQGIQGFVVVVESLSKAALEAGLTEESVEALVSGQLVLAGIKVLTKKEWKEFKNPGAALYVNINAVKIPLGSTYAYSIRIEVKQNAVLARLDREVRSSDLVLATTWMQGELGAVPELDYRNRFLNTVKNTLKELTELFITDYLLANPRKKANHDILWLWFT